MNSDIMAKRKKRSSKKSVKQVPQHTLPAGFWSQVGAVILAALSVLFVVAWFGVGGPVLEWMQSFTLSLIGWAVYVLPLLFVFIAARAASFQHLDLFAHSPLLAHRIYALMEILGIGCIAYATYRSEWQVRVPGGGVAAVKHSKSNI